MGINVGVLLLFAAICCAHNIGLIVANTKVLETIVNSAISWPLETLFNNMGLMRNKTDFTIEGIAPCILEEGRIILSSGFVYQEQERILDFVVLNKSVIYLTPSSLRRFRFDSPDVSVPNSMSILHILPQSIFYYIEGFVMANGDELLFLKGESPALGYARIDGKTNLSEALRITPPNFGELTDTSKITMYNDVFFIPAGTQGLHVYAYLPDVQRLECKSVLLNNPQGQSDVRAAAVQADPQNPGKWLIVVADYAKGLHLLEFNPATFEGKLVQTMLERERPRFVASTWVEREEKFIILGDLNIGLSAYILARIGRVSQRSQLQIEKIIPLDSEAQYGDISHDFVLVLMKNSIYVATTQLHRSSEIMLQSTPNLTHAKITQFSAGSEAMLMYTQNTSIRAGRLHSSLGNLVCRVGSEPTTYKFNIIGTSKNCTTVRQGPHLEGHADCLFTVETTLHVTKSTFDKMWTDFRVWVIAISIVILLILIIILIAVVIVIRRERLARQKLGEYEKLDSARNPVNFEPRPPGNMENKA